MYLVKKICQTSLKFAASLFESIYKQKSYHAVQNVSYLCTEIQFFLKPSFPWRMKTSTFYQEKSSERNLIWSTQACKTLRLYHRNISHEYQLQGEKMWKKTISQTKQSTYDENFSCRIILEMWSFLQLLFNVTKFVFLSVTYLLCPENVLKNMSGKK